MIHSSRIRSEHAVGCPVCNKLVLLALGASGAVSWFAPIQPFLAIASVVLMAVAMVLAGRPSPIQTRELVYTALTRAKESVRWVGSERELELALATRTERVSSLGTRLSPAPFTS